jgi:hypothetical protein
VITTIDIRSHYGYTVIDSDGNYCFAITHRRKRSFAGDAAEIEPIDITHIPLLSKYIDKG